MPKKRQKGQNAKMQKKSCQRPKCHKKIPRMFDKHCIGQAECLSGKISTRQVLRVRKGIKKSIFINILAIGVLTPAPFIQLGGFNYNNI